MSLPNTFLIGAQKAGTTSVYDWLGQHPEVWAPAAAKDVHFFSSEDLYQNGSSHLSRLFSADVEYPVVVDGAVNYLFFEHVPQRVHKFKPDAKIIIVLRNPFERAISAFNYFTKLGVETRSFQQALKEESEGKLKSFQERADFTYIEHGLYCAQIRRWLQFFSQKQMLIAFFEELMKDKESGLRRIFEFLQIDTTFKADFNHVNRTGQARWGFLNRFFFSDNNAKRFVQKFIPYKRFVRLETRNKWANQLREWNTSTKTLQKKGTRFYFPPQQHQLLVADIKRLEVLLNKDLFSLWELKPFE